MPRITLLCGAAAAALLIPPRARAQDTLEYAAKFVCGRVSAQTAIFTAPGAYYTSINIHNPNRETLGFNVKFARAGNAKADTVSGWRTFRLAYDQAMSLNCATILRALAASGFVEGYVVIDSRLALDVTGVYTAAGTGGLVSTEQIVRVAPRALAAACTPSPPQPWVPDTVPISTALHGVWGPAANDIFAVGFAAKIIHNNGAAWALQPVPGTGFTLTDVWGSSGTDVWATMAPGDSLFHYNGAAWSIVTVSGTRGSTQGVWGNHSWDVFVVGNGGAIIHFDGTNWSPQISGTTTDLLAVWAARDSNVFAVGRKGTILHWNGSFWTPQPSGTTNDLNGVWGTSGNEVFAVGNGGTILRYDGTSWSPMTSGTQVALNGVWGSSSCNIFVVGGGGTVLHYTGSSWAAEPSGTTEPLMDIWGFAGLRAYTVGGTAASVTVRRRAL